MSEQNQPETQKPIRRMRSGNVIASIWEHENPDGRLYYTTTYSKSYLDKESGEWKYTSSFTRSENNEFSPLTLQVNQQIDMLDDVNRENRKRLNNQEQLPLQEQPQSGGLRTQRDAAMLNAPQQVQQQTQSQNPEQHPRTPPHVPDQ